MSNTDDQKKKPGAGAPPHINDLILGSLKPRTGKETSRWIAGLAEDSVQNAIETAAHEQEMERSLPPNYMRPASGWQAVTSFVDHLFDCFQQYEFDFNRTVMGTEYVVTIERATLHQETIRQRFQASETVQTFKGRCSTRYWTLIIRAWNEQVDAWILPVEQIFSFRADDESYLPILHVEPVANRNGELAWRVNDFDIPWADARKLAKQLFGTLIKVAKGEAQPTDKFSMRPKQTIEPSAPQPVTNLPTKPMDQSQSLQNFNMSGSMKKPELQKPEPLAKPEGTGGSPRNTQKNVARKAQAEAAAAQAMAGEQNFDAVIETLNRYMTRELEKLSAAGAEAFSKQDLAGVERTFKRSTRLKDLHTQMGAALVQWKQAVKDALESQ